MNEMQTLIEQIGKHWGWEVGDKVRQEIQAVLAAEDVDIKQLQSAIQTIQGLLDADPSTEEFDVGQNIVTQLSDHLSRITGLETDMNRLKGDETVAGSVAYAVKQERDRAQAVEAQLRQDTDANTAAINTLNGDKTVEGSVAKKVKDAVDAEAAARTQADAALQAQIDEITGGSGNSLSSIQGELDATQAGAGLNGDGSYTADQNANYIKDATSLMDADKKLDAAIKNVETQAAAQAKAAESNAKQYADDTFVTKAQIASISAATLASIFRHALDCGFDGKPKDGVLNGTGDCATANGGSGDGGDGDDGAVI